MLADRAFQDGRPDFLANDAPDPERLPDTLYLSDGSIVPVSAVTSASFLGTLSPGQPADHPERERLARAGLTCAWEIPPARMASASIGVRRDDNSLIALGTNVWTTDRIFPGGATRPVKTNLLHLVDYNSSGTYTLLYELATPTVDSIAPISAVASLPSGSPAQFAVTWSGTDGANASGVAYYDIYVSVNGGAATNWLPRTTLTGSMFNGVQGASYAFFSVATDSAGNVESAPVTPDAQTTVNVVNTAPTLSLGADAHHRRRQHSQHHAHRGRHGFSSANADLFVAARRTGGIALQRGERCRDLVHRRRQRAEHQPDSRARGRQRPAQLEHHLQRHGHRARGEHAAVAGSIGDRTINELFRLAFTATASDADLPANALTYSLGAGTPSGATINPLTGQFVWRPTATQGPSTNRISILVNDGGVPSLTTTQSFTVMVRDSQADYVVSIGTTNVFAGQTSAVPVSLDAGLDLALVQFNLEASADRLTNLVMGTLAGEVTSVTLIPVGPNQAQVRFNLNGSGPVANSRTLGLLNFFATTNGYSAIVPLRLSGLSAQTIGGATVNLGAGNDGRVIIVERQPVLTLQNPLAPLLTLYGTPGSSYVIESEPNLASSAWTTWQGVTLERAFQELPARRESGRRVLSGLRDERQIVANRGVAGRLGDLAAAARHGGHEPPVADQHQPRQPELAEPIVLQPDQFVPGSDYHQRRQQGAVLSVVRALTRNGFSRDARLGSTSAKWTPAAAHTVTDG